MLQEEKKAICCIIAFNAGAINPVDLLNNIKI